MYDALLLLITKIKFKSVYCIFYDAESQQSTFTCI